MKKYCLYFLLILSASVQAQELAIEWANVYGGSMGEIPKHTIEADDGNYILLGASMSSDIDLSTNNGLGDVWIVKIDQYGEILWQHSYGGSDYDYPRRICHAHDGGYLIVGFTMSSDGDISNYYGNVDVWLLKLDSAGVLEWEKNYGGTGGEGAQDLIQTADGGYIICASTDSNDGDVSNQYGTGDVWLVKIDSIGTIEWEKSYGGTNYDGGFRVVQKEEGGYIVAGNSKSSDLDVSTNYGNNDLWVFTTDSLGNIVWEKNYGSTSTDDFSDMIIAHDGTILMVGKPWQWNMDVTEYIGNADVWMLNIDAANGAILWNRAYGGTTHDELKALTKTPDGGYALFCETTSDDGDITYNNGNGDLWVVKLDSNFDIVAEKCVGNQNSEICYTGLYTSDESLLIVGEIAYAGGQIDTNYGFSDIWMVKLIDEASTDELISGIRIFPNPASSFITIQGVSNSASSYSIVDQLGRVVQFGDLNQNLQIDVSEISEGLYYLQIEEFTTAILIE